MGLSVQGIEYQIKVDPGRSTSNADKLTKSLLRLDAAVAKVQKTIFEAGSAEEVLARNLELQQQAVAELTGVELLNVEAVKAMAKADEVAAAAAEALAAEVETASAAVAAATTVIAANVEVVDRWAAGIGSLNEQWASQASWRSGIANINEAYFATRDATAATDKWAVGMTTLDAQWAGQASMRAGISNINASAQATREAEAATDKWAVGNATLSKSWEDGASWRAGRDQITAMARAEQDAARNVDRWAVGMGHLNKEFANGAPWRKGQAALDEAGKQGYKNSALGELPVLQSPLTKEAGAGFQKSMDKLQPGASQALAQMKAPVEEEAEAANKASVANKALAGSLAVVAGILLVDKIAGWVSQMTLLAGRVQNLETVMDHVGHTMAISRGQMFVMETQMKSLGITTQVSREILTRFAQNNLNVADSLKIARIAQDAAVVAGQNSSETAERMMMAVQRLDTRMLRNLGILINLRNEYQKFALVTGRAENSLSANEKQQIVLNAVMRAGVALAGSYESALADVYKQYTSLARKAEEAGRSIGQYFTPVFAEFVSVADTVLTALAEQGSWWAKFVAILLGAGVGVGIAVAILGIIAAFTGLVAVLGTAASTIGIVLAIGAALGLLTTWGVASSNAMKSLTDQSQRQAEAAGYQRSRLRQLADEMERLSSIQNQTDEQKSQLINDQEEVNTLLTKEEQATLRATKSMTEYVAVIRGLQRLGGPVSESDVTTLGRMQKRVEEINAQLKTLDDYYGSKKGDRKEMMVDGSTAEIAKERLELEQQIKVIQDEANMQRLRRLNDLATATENLDQIAIRAKEALDKVTLDNIGLKGAKELSENINLYRDLSAAVLTLSEIQEKASLKIKDARDQEEVQERIINASKDSKEEKEAKIEEQKIKLAKAESAINLEAKGEIDAQAERVDTVNRLYGNLTRTLEDYQRAHREQAFIADLEAKGLGDVAKNLISLNAVYRNAADGQAYFATQLKDSEKKLTDLKAAIAGGTKIEHGDSQVAALEGVVAAWKELLKDLPTATLDKFNETLRETAHSAHFDEDSVRKLRNETALLAQENDLLAAGVDKELISAFTQAAEASQKYQDEAEGLIAVHKSLEDQLEEVNKKIRATELWGQPGDIAALHDQANAIMAALAKLAEAMGVFQARRVEEEKKTLAEITRLQDEAYKKEVDNLSTRVDTEKKKLDDMVKDRKDALGKTAEAIFKQNLQLGNFGSKGPLMSAMHDLYAEFSPLVKGAGSKDQINQLGSLFNQRVRNDFGNAAQKGPLAPMFATLEQQLNQDATDRAKELQVQDDMLRNQILIANNSIQEVQILKAMLIGGKTKDEITEALKKQELVGASNVEVDRAQQRFNNSVDKDRDRTGNLRAAAQRVKALKAMGAPPDQIAEAESDLRIANYNSHERQRNGKFAPQMHSQETTDADLALTAAKKARDDAAKQAGVPVPQVVHGGVPIGSPLGKALEDGFGDFGKRREHPGQSLHGMEDYFKPRGVTGTGLGAIFRGFLEAFSGAQQTASDLSEADKAKADATVAALKDQQKANEAATEAARKATKDIKDISAKTKRSMSANGLRN